MSRGSANQRVSALKRLGLASTTNNFQASTKTGPTGIRDARQLLSKKKSTPFDARQIINRQTSDTSTGDVAVRNRLSQMETISGNNAARKNKMVVVTGLGDMKIQDGQLVTNSSAGLNDGQKKKKVFSVDSTTFVTIRNPTNSKQMTGTNSLTKTIQNSAAILESNQKNMLSSDEKFVISFVNDNYTKQTVTTTRPLSTTTEIVPVSKRLHDASIQTARATTTSTAARPPIRTNSQQRHTGTNTIQSKKRAISEDEEDDFEPAEESQEEFYEPPVKRTNTTMIRTTRDEGQQLRSNINQRISTSTSTSNRIASNKTKPTSTTTGTILITNLQPSVTEEDVIELFEHCGQINEIKTLSQGCVQIIYAQREFAEKAVADYHNRLLDGELMYVSLQLSTKTATKKSSSTDSKATPINTSHQPKDSGASNQPSKQNNTTTTATTTTSNSNKIVIDPVFMRQALFHPTNNTANSVQFQVKL